MAASMRFSWFSALFAAFRHVSWLRKQLLDPFGAVFQCFASERWQGEASIFARALAVEHAAARAASHWALSWF